MKEVYEFLKIGGVLMIPIAIGSVIALAIFIERLWALQKSKIAPDGLAQKIIDFAEKREFSKARDIALSSNTPLGRILLTGIDAKDEDRANIKIRFEEAGRQEMARMNRFIEAMGTTASVEPLMGLLGTVTGMIKVFQKVVGSSSSGAVDPAQLASGIWQALMTTAAGLSVAIVAFVGYRYLQSVSSSRAIAMEGAAIELLDAIIPSASFADEKKSEKSSSGKNSSDRSPKEEKK
ncbi:MAG: MotA/TolQ/ExbB proton channel family protein [Deltaproteobacteria bacterium]|nr:MotA/TolQ/ExbB proton channel family protein [Deltaproteobacteria bacterium]